LGKSDYLTAIVCDKIKLKESQEIEKGYILEKG
jgi:hypothetical protein